MVAVYGSLFWSLIKKWYILSGSALKCIVCSGGLQEGFCGENEEGTSVGMAIFWFKTSPLDGKNLCIGLITTPDFKIKRNISQNNPFSQNCIVRAWNVNQHLCLKKLFGTIGN